MAIIGNIPYFQTYPSMYEVCMMASLILQSLKASQVSCRFLNNILDTNDAFIRPHSVTLQVGSHIYRFHAFLTPACRQDLGPLDPHGNPFKQNKVRRSCDPGHSIQCDFGEATVTNGTIFMVTNGWNIPEGNGDLNGKPSVNGGCSSATFDYRRVKHQMIYRHL